MRTEPALRPRCTRGRQTIGTHTRHATMSDALFVSAPAPSRYAAYRQRKREVGRHAPQWLHSRSHLNSAPLQRRKRCATAASERSASRRGLPLHCPFPSLPPPCQPAPPPPPPTRSPSPAPAPAAPVSPIRDDSMPLNSADLEDILGRLLSPHPVAPATAAHAANDVPPSLPLSPARFCLTAQHAFRLAV